MKKPVVSVIMPVYKVEKYVAESITSVLNQTYKDFELILVDDGSPDKSGLICDDFAKKDERIRVIHKENGGLSSARNAGLDIAKGEYVYFIDSDDTVETDLLKEVVSTAQKSNSDVVIFGIHSIVFSEGKVVSDRYIQHSQTEYNCNYDITDSFYKLADDGVWNYAWDKLYKLSTIKENGVSFNSFYDRVCEDTAFLLDLLPYVEKINVIEGCYYNYFIRDNQSVVKTFIPERYEKYYGRYKKTEDVVLKHCPTDNNIRFLYNIYCTFILWAYEFMFHKDCKYSLLKRYFYMKKLFSIRKEPKQFRKNALIYFRSSDTYINASKTSQKVVDNLLKNRYFTAWLYHIAALVKNK